MNNIKDFIKGLDTINFYPGISSIIEDENDLKVIRANSNAVLNNIEDQDVIDTLETIETSAPYFLLDTGGSPDKVAVALLEKNGYKLVHLSSDYKPYDYAISHPQWNILFGF